MGYYKHIVSQIQHAAELAAEHNISLVDYDAAAGEEMHYLKQSCNELEAENLRLRCKVSKLRRKLIFSVYRKSRK